MNIDAENIIRYYHKGMTERGGCGGPVLFAMVLLAFLLCGCKTNKIMEKTDTNDSVRIEYVEKVVKVPVTVYVEVPVEVKEKFSNDSTSHLETSFAVSDASMVWIDGVAFLRHTLANKPQKVEKKDSVAVTEKEKTIYKTRRVTYTVKETEYVEKELSWWQKMRLWLGNITLIGLLGLVGYGGFRIYKAVRIF